LKVDCSAKDKARLEILLDKFVGKLIQCKSGTAIIEAVGDQSQIKQLLEALDEFGIKELIRTGRIALAY